MYCPSCGKEVRDTAKFCAHCGRPMLTPPPAVPEPEATTYLPEQHSEPPPPPPIYAPPPAYTPPPAYQPYSPPPEQPPGKQRRSFAVPRWLLILGGGLAALLLLGGLFLWLDPFNLNLFGRLTGRYDAIAEAMPADTQLYMSVNLLNLNQARLEKLQNTFTDAADQTGDSSDFNELERELDDLLQEIENEWGITFAEDIQPWIGQYAGVGIRRVRFDSYGEPESGDILAAIEVRNTVEADAFLRKLTNAWEENENVTVAESTYQDVLIYELDEEYSDPIAFARSGNIIYIGNGVRAIRQGIDAQKRDSLAQQETFRQTIQTLPGERGLTFYVTAGLADDFAQATDAGRRVFSRQGLTAVAMTLTLIDEGIRLDAATGYDPANLSAAVSNLHQYKPTKVDNLLPANTIGYLSGSRPDLLWQIWRDAMIEVTSRADFNEAMDYFEDEYGFDPDKEFFPLLNGMWTIALVPSRDGVFAREMGVDLGGALLLQTSDPNAMNKLADDFADALEQWTEVNSRTRSGQTVYEVMDGSTPLFAYGLDGAYLTFASGYDEVGLVSAGGGLDKAEKYRQALRVFPRGLTPYLYLDVTALLDALNSGLTGYELDDFVEVEPLFRPITAVAAASKTSENITQQTIILFVDLKP